MQGKNCARRLLAAQQHGRYPFRGKVLWLLLLGLGISIEGYAIEYQLSAAMTGYGQLGIVDWAGGYPYPNQWVNLSFNTISETVYFDPAAGTLRQVGFLSASPASGDLVFNESRTINGETVPGTLTVHQEIPNGGISFDTGTCQLTWDGALQAYHIHSPGDAAISLSLPIRVNGYYSLSTGGHTYSNAFSYTLANRVNTFTPFEWMSTDGSPGQITLSGMGGGIQVYKGTSPVVADLTADNGFEMALGTGVSDWTDYFNWSCNSAQASLVPEPTGAGLVGLGLFAILLTRRKRE